jgi:hypothetical protein
MKNIILIILTFTFIGTKAQLVKIDTSHIHDSIINGNYIPKDIEDCFKELCKPKYERIKSLLITISEETIDKKFKSTADFWMDWYLQGASRLTKYFNDLGIIYAVEMQPIILHTFYRRLHNLPIRFEEELIKYRNNEAREEEVYQKKLRADTINGIYIPRNIEDCFKQLDKLLSNADIQQIKNLKDKSETIKYHHNFGLWIRNNWGMWSGSRFQLYMLDRIKTEPDGMSSIILEFYWEWLNGINDNWKKFDQKIKK